MTMNFFEIMQKAKAIQDELSVSQKRLSSLEVEGRSGGDMVKIAMTCDYKVVSVKIDESVKGDISLIEDLVKLAVNDALNKVSAEAQKNIGAGMEALGLPADFKLPF